MTEAKRESLLHYYTGKPCKHGHIALRLVSTRTCIECTRQHVKNRYHNLGGKEYILNWRKENKDRLSKETAAWQRANPEKRAATARKYRQNNKEKIQARYNPVDKLARVNLRRAIKQNATPAWVNIEQIKNLYALSKKISIETGIPHHVDHIVPLNGVNVCGLHTLTNLQIIPASENLKKGRKHEI